MTLIAGETKYKIDFTFALTVTLMVILCDEETVVVSLMSSCLHEFGHLYFIHLFSQKVEKITFGAFGVRIDRQVTASLSYKKEALIALGGILINFMVASFGAIYYSIHSSEFFLKLTLVNIIIALFNTIPLDALDMGRVLRYTLLCRFDESSVEKILTVISMVSVNLLAVTCLAVNIFTGFNLSLVIVTVYLYVITLFKKWS